MENAFKEALAANDLPKVRALLVETILNGSSDPETINSVTEVLETTPGLFDDDNGKTYAPSAREMTPQLTRQLIEDLKHNFSLEKFKLLTETYALQVEGFTPPADEETDTTAKPKCKCNCGRYVGIVIMVLGCAAAIVGICLPSIKFLLGLGIAVFMLGSVVLYTNLKN